MSPGPGAYEQDSYFDKMIDREKIRRKKQNSYSVNPSLSHIATSNTSINYRDPSRSDSHVLDQTANKSMKL
jgi:hypothetical protein